MSRVRKQPKYIHSGYFTLQRYVLYLLWWTIASIVEVAVLRCGCQICWAQSARAAMPGIKELIVRLLLGLLAIGLKVNLYPLAKLYGYRRFEPKPNSVIVTCCTNGLGHIHQMERVLGTLQEEGMKFPVVALARESKVPAYKLKALKEKFPETKFVDLNFEIDYDNGKSFRNSDIAMSATKTTLLRSGGLVRRVVGLLKKHRPQYCLSFWEPGAATIINVLNCPTRIVSVASQGQLFADGTGGAQGHGFVMRGMHQLNVGKKGTLVPLSVRELPGAIPQIVRLPEAQPLGDERGDFYVAYTTAPQVLSPLKTKLAGRVMLFVKEKRLAYYTRKYRKYAHVEVRPTAPDFADYLARSRGLIASPSRGVVTQAVAIGKPVYLFCPRGHVEQEYNLAFYLRYFEGVAAPRTRRYRRYVKGKYIRARRRNVAPDGWPGELLSLAEWEAKIANKSYELAEQAAALSGWLGQIDPLIKKRLLPLLRSDDAPADEAADEAADDDAANDAAVEEEVPEEEKVLDEEVAMAASEAKAAESDEEEDPDDVEDEDDVEVEPEHIKEDIDEAA